MNSPTKQTMKSHKDWISLFLWISLFSAFLWGCSTNRKLYLGKRYVNDNRSRLIDLLLWRPIVLKTKIELYADSTYYYETCAVKSYGKWKTDGQKVYLFCDTMFYKIDSLNYMPKYIKYLKHHEPTDTFYIKKNKLIQYTKNPRTIERLIKVK